MGGVLIAGLLLDCMAVILARISKLESRVVDVGEVEAGGVAWTGGFWPDATTGVGAGTWA